MGRRHGTTRAVSASLRMELEGKIFMNLS
uniref:OSJNBb0020O11.9 protein n=1 Tax=Oryza sativa subsp. japonica TaxID=39947 RepID=Q7XU72_ORYSJ|nr:OSJNBb0020O11.9 [Oryza sativa Japonica Group]